MSNLTKQQIELLKSFSSKDGLLRASVNEEKQVIDLISKSQNASQIIQSLSAEELYNLMGQNTKLLQSMSNWSSLDKIALIKKNVNFFSVMPYTFSDWKLTDQNIIEAGLNEINLKFSPVNRYYEYSTKFKSTFRLMFFNDESLEILIKSMPEESPFVFYEHPFRDIPRWRQLIKSNPNLALQSRMLDAMDEANFFSKSSMLEFKTKYNDLLKMKVFYNYFIQKANNDIKDKIISEKSKMQSDIDDAEYNGDYDKAEDYEDELNKIVQNFEESFEFIKNTFGPYKDMIMEQEMSKKKVTNKRA